MGFIEYMVNITPAKPGANLSASATPSSLTVKVDSIDSVTLKVEPKPGTIVAGAISGAILGLFTGGPAFALLMGGAGVGTVYAVAALIQSKVQDALTSKLNELTGTQQTFDFGKPLGYSINVQGVDVNVSLKTLQLSTYDGMLMATGDLDVQ